MKNRLLCFAFAVICVFSCAFAFSACENVVPCAWVKLDMEGYVYYSSNMYASGGHHVYLYENQEASAADTYRAGYMMAITFYPRILGADTIEGVRTTTVDISRWYSMTVYISKSSSIYDEGKHIYLNGEVLEASQTDDLSSLLCLSFEDFSFVRGNPGGTLNNFVNVIEYK